MAKVGPPADKNVTILQHVRALSREMDRRYRAILAEMDLRYQQRYDAQIKAVEAAFLAQQTAMQAALLAAEKAVQTAMTASEKAVTKAEVAAEKRFDAVNEFRGAYQDIIAQQMPRAEAEQRLTAMSEKIDDLKSAFQERQGRSSGLNAGWTYLVGAAGIIAVIITIILKIN